MSGNDYFFVPYAVELCFYIISNVSLSSDTKKSVI